MIATIRFAPALALLACTTTSHSTAHDPDASIASIDASRDAPAGGLTIEVTDAKLDRELGTILPVSGNVFIDLGVTLSNTGEVSVIPDAFALYSLSTTDHLIYAADATSAFLTTPCGTVSVAPGGHLTCRVAFSIPLAAAPAQLTYTEPTSHDTAFAPVQDVAPLPFDTCLAWARLGSAQCTPCTQSVLSQGGTCAALEATIFGPVCASCAGVISSVESGICPSLTACTPTAACQDAVNAFENCLATACDAHCL